MKLNFARIAIGLLSGSAVALFLTTQLQPELMPGDDAKEVKLLRQCLDGTLAVGMPENNCSVELAPARLPGPGDADIAARLASRLEEMYSKQVIEYNCVVGNGIQLCGGFGDRARGLVSTFYMALLSNSILHVNSTTPVDLGYYYRQNDDLYHVDEDAIKELTRQPDRPPVRCFMDQGNEDPLRAFASETTSNGTFPMLTNSLFGVLGALENPAARQLACYYLGHFEDYVRNPASLHHGILVSAALRVLFGQPRQELQQEIDRVIDTQKDLWQTSTKIGVQARTENLDWYEFGRFSSDQLPCFVTEVQRLVAELKISRPLVYVTGDKESSIATLLQAFETVGIKAFRDGIHTEMVHLDRNHLFTDESLVNSDKLRRVWMNHARSFVDWAMLTKMDYLVISRSGFSETAHMYSLAPTRRFVHQKRDADGNLIENDCCQFEPYSLPVDFRMQVNEYVKKKQ